MQGIRELEILAMLDRRQKSLGAAAAIFTATKQYITPARRGSCEVRFTFSHRTA
jgi:hypothetical protein